jgi:DNA-binding NarL/FixJ family response regulator
MPLSRSRFAQYPPVILCVDDEPKILDGLTPALSRRYLVKTAASGPAALDVLRAIPTVSVIISDMRMPHMDGAQFLAMSRRIAPNARRMLLTGHADVPTAMAAVNEGGICRFLTKPCPVAEVIEAIDEEIAAELAGSGRTAFILEATYALTPTEIEVAQLLAQGQSAKTIAAKRCVAVGTVRAQIKAVMAKFGVNRQVEVIVRLNELRPMGG